MAALTSLFVRSGHSLRDLASAFEKKLGIQFHSERDEAGLRLICKSLYISLAMFDDHGLENDMGIDFASYQFDRQQRSTGNTRTTTFVTCCNRTLRCFLFRKND